MKKLILTLIVLFILFWDLAWQIAGVQQLFPWQLKSLLRTGEVGIVLADARLPAEYEWKRIPGARSLPDLMFHPERLDNLPPDRPIVVVCLTGHRSQIAAWRLQHRGHTRVFNLTWGMVGWILSDGPVTSGEP